MDPRLVKACGEVISGLFKTHGIELSGYLEAPMDLVPVISGLREMGYAFGKAKSDGIEVSDSALCEEIWKTRSQKNQLREAGVMAWFHDEVLQSRENLRIILRGNARVQFAAYKLPTNKSGKITPQDLMGPVEKLCRRLDEPIPEATAVTKRALETVSKDGVEPATLSRTEAHRGLVEVLIDVYVQHVARVGVESESNVANGENDLHTVTIPETQDHSETVSKWEVRALSEGNHFQLHVNSNAMPDTETPLEIPAGTAIATIGVIFIDLKPVMQAEVKPNDVQYHFRMQGTDYCCLTEQDEVSIGARFQKLSDILERVDDKDRRPNIVGWHHVDWEGNQFKSINPSQDSGVLIIDDSRSISAEGHQYEPSALLQLQKPTSSKFALAWWLRPRYGQHSWDYRPAALALITAEDVVLNQGEFVNI